MLTPEDLKAIRERCEAATKGPWKVNSVGAIEADGEPVCEVPPYAITPDATFIAHAREDMPRLLDEVERLRKALEAKWWDLREELRPKHITPDSNLRLELMTDEEVEALDYHVWFIDSRLPGSDGLRLINTLKRSKSRLLASEAELAELRGSLETKRELLDIYRHRYAELQKLVDERLLKEEPKP